MEYESLKDRIDSIVTECENILKLLNTELDSIDKISFQQIKEIERTITRLQKRGLNIPDELKELKLRLLLDSEKKGAIVPLKKYFIENIQKFLSHDIKKKLKKTKPGKNSKRKPRSFPPDGTLCRFIYKGNDYNGQIQDGQLNVNGYGVFSSLSSASVAISGTSRNGWRDWELKIPESDHWLLADIWRKKLKK